MSFFQWADLNHIDLNELRPQPIDFTYEKTQFHDHNLDPDQHSSHEKVFTLNIINHPPNNMTSPYKTKTPLRPYVPKPIHLKPTIR